MKRPFTCGLATDQAVWQAIENGNCNLVAFCHVLNEQAKDPPPLIRETVSSGVSDLHFEAKAARQADEMGASTRTEVGWSAAGILASLSEMG